MISVDLLKRRARALLLLLVARAALRGASLLPRLGAHDVDEARVVGAGEYERHHHLGELVRLGGGAEALEELLDRRRGAAGVCQ